MKKIILIFFIFSIFLFSDVNKKYINIIQNNISFVCNFKKEVIPLIGENFTGSYYKGKPYGLWELKNGKVKQCFLNKERKYYYEEKYYIVDNPYYYLKINYQNGIYIIKDKRNKNKIFYYEKKNGKYIQKKDVFEEIKLPKPLYKLMYFKREAELKIKGDFEEEFREILQKER